MPAVNKGLPPVGMSRLHADLPSPARAAAEPAPPPARRPTEAEALQAMWEEWSRMPRRFDPSDPPPIVADANFPGRHTVGWITVDTAATCPQSGLPLARYQAGGPVPKPPRSIYDPDNWPTPVPSWHPAWGVRLLAGTGPGARGAVGPGGMYLTAEDVGLDPADIGGGSVWVAKQSIEVLNARHGGRFRHGVRELVGMLLVGDWGLLGTAQDSGVVPIPDTHLPAFRLWSRSSINFAARVDRVAWPTRGDYDTPVLDSTSDTRHARTSVVCFDTMPLPLEWRPGGVTLVVAPTELVHQAGL